MRHNKKGFFIFLLFILILVFPKTAFSGAANGLMLWFETLLPTLFPFLLITNLLILTGNLGLISSVAGGFLSWMFQVSYNGSFAVVTGFLCGYPVGAKTAADLVSSGYISKAEGQYLLSVCNNTSPMFIMNILIWQILGDKTLFFPTLIILFSSPVIVSFFTRKIYLNGKKHFTDLRPIRSSAADWSIKEVDACIMDSFETLIKIGGYIMLFSILLCLIQDTPFIPSFLLWFSPVLEITNGLVLLKAFRMPFYAYYPAVLALTSFGGFCAAAQTQCMVLKAGFSIRRYLVEKLAVAGTASLLGLLYSLLTV